MDGCCIQTLNPPHGGPTASINMLKVTLVHVFLCQETDFFAIIFKGYRNGTRTSNGAGRTQSDEGKRQRFQSYSPTGPGVDQRDRGQREACTGRPLPCVSFGPRGIVLMVRLLPTLKYWEISLKDPGFRLLIKINRDDLAWHSHGGKCCLRFHLPVKSSTAAHFLAVQIQAPF